MNRRGLLIGAIGAGAGAAGLGLALRGPAPATSPGPAMAAAPSGAPDGAGPAAPGSPAAEAVAGGLWDLSFDRPEGGSLVMAQQRGRWTLLNFWATWCPPCVKEIPLLDTFHREQGGRGWQVVALAIDGPTPVRQFLARSPVVFAVGLAGLQGMDLVRTLGNLSGALPFTVILDPAGSVVDRKLGELRPADLGAWAQRYTPAR